MKMKSIVVGLGILLFASIVALAVVQNFKQRSLDRVYLGIEGCLKDGGYQNVKVLNVCWTPMGNRHGRGVDGFAFVASTDKGAISGKYRPDIAKAYVDKVKN
jgi:hypothetical protein